MRKIKTTLLFLFFVIFVVSCTANLLGFFYNRIDSYLLKKIDNYFSLNISQKEIFSKKIREVHHWHRKKELPKYADILDKIYLAIKKPLTQEEYESLEMQMKKRGDILMNQSIPIAADFLVTLTPQQIENLMKRWQKEQEEQKNADSSKTYQKEIQKLNKRFSFFYRYMIGSLTKEQALLLKNTIATIPSSYFIASSQMQIQRQNELIELLHSSKAKDKTHVQQTLSNWILEKNHPMYYQKAVKQYKTFLNELILSIDATLSDRQRNNLSKRMRSLSKEIRSL